jgi:hypothetical protein
MEEQASEKNQRIVLIVMRVDGARIKCFFGCAKKLSESIIPRNPERAQPLATDAPN